MVRSHHRLTSQVLHCRQTGSPWSIPALLGLIALAGLAGSSATAAEVRLPVTADTSIASYPSEQRNQNGHNSQIKLKGTENFILFDVDTHGLVGLEVGKAVLHIRGCDVRLMVRKVGLSTVATPWDEGTSCFVSPALGSGRLWAQAGSTFVDATFGRGGTMWTQTMVAKLPGTWYAIPIEGRLIEACAAGISHGLVLSDDNGETALVSRVIDPQTNQSNNRFFAREQHGSEPYLIIDTQTAPTITSTNIPIHVLPWRAGADESQGGVEISWAGPATGAIRQTILGFRVRAAIGSGALTGLPAWQIPSIPPAGHRVRILLGSQKAGAPVTVEVEVVGRGGRILAHGKGQGLVSQAFPAVAAIAPVTLPREAAGPPPANSGGDVWAVPDLAKVNPITGNVMEETGVDYRGAPAGRYRQANPGWSGRDRTVSLQALGNEWVAFQIVCDAAKPSTGWSISPGPFIDAAGHGISGLSIRLSRLWYQHVGSTAHDWYADPMLPLAAGASFAIPDPKNAVPGQTNQTVYGECFVPRTLRPGSYSCPIVIRNGGGADLAMTVHLKVLPVAIPDPVAFHLSLNGYSSPGQDFGDTGSAAYLEGERSFYSVAHEHRCTLAVLGYSHEANFEWGRAWPLTGSGRDMHVADWSAWDRRFGPLFDGSAFAGTSRAGVPMDHFYLPFMESWPTPMAKGYAWNQVRWEDHWKVAGSVEQGFSQLYQDQFVAVLRDFEAHVKAKGWKTTFHAFFNDKDYYKMYNAGAKREGRGTSFWLLDEPKWVDDFSALAFFGKLVREGQQGDRSRVQYRVDVSGPQWGRDLLDRVVDLQDSGDFANSQPWLEDWRNRYGQIIWTYGDTPSSATSALGIEHQVVDLYSRGVQGYVPWLVLGGPDNWTHFADTCLLYTGKPMGLPGACSSLRLKAYRRGEEDVEDIQLLAAQKGLLADDPCHHRIAIMLGPFLTATRQKGVLDAQGGAITESFAGLRLENVATMQRSVQAGLRAQSPQRP